MTSFHASLTGGELRAVLEVLSAWLETDDFKIQHRIAGTEVVHEAKGVYVFCQEGLPAPGARASFLLEGTIGESPEAAVARLRPLRQLCATQAIELQLEYVALDDDGNEVGDERSLP